MSLGNKTKRIIIILLIIFIVVFVIIPLAYRSYNGFIIKASYSREKTPNLYILPVERKIVDIENQTQENFKINYARFELKLPCKEVERVDSDTTSKRLAIIIDKGVGKGIVVSIQPKDRDEKGTSYETYSKMLYMTPDQINFFKVNFFSIDEKYQVEFQEKFLLLNKKQTCKFVDGNIYKFETSNLNGFQFGDPNNTKKYVEVEIFDKNDNHYKLIFVAFSQKEIDYTLASIRFKE